jgi:putative tricarboxylic transport membrane protein
LFLIPIQQAQALMKQLQPPMPMDPSIVAKMDVDRQTEADKTKAQLEAGKIRVLAVLSDDRLPGKLSNIPTAKEQGYDISWPVIRGFYMGPEVSDEDFNWWKTQFDTLLADEDFAKLREQRDLFPLSMTGDELKAFVNKQVADYKELAGEFGLVK